MRLAFLGIFKGPKIVNIGAMTRAWQASQRVAFCNDAHEFSLARRYFTL